MRTKTEHIVQYSIRTFLLMFWLYVALDKLWGLSTFHHSLLRQPFPNWWADLLYWALPSAELALAWSFLIQRSEAAPGSGSGSGKRSAIPYLLSAILLLIFTIYIALGVAGLYAERPCGCASVFSRLTWTGHLLVNAVLIGLSILGWYLTGPTTPMGKRRMRHKRSILLFRTCMLLIVVPLRFFVLSVTKRFPRKFAPFPGRPVSKNLYWTFVALP